MLGYIKEKSSNGELYETSYLSNIKGKKTKFAKLQYLLCFTFYELIVKIKYLFNLITIKKIYDAYIFILPFDLKTKMEQQNKNTNLKSEKKHIKTHEKIKLKKCMKKVRKLIEKYKIDNLVFSNKLEKSLNIFEEEVTRKVHILDGSGLMPYLIKDILEYILEEQGEKIELEDLYFCMKEPKQIYIDNISYLGEYFRNIHVITPNITKFQKIIEKIEEKENIVVTISNNKKKSLKKAKWIINFDFEDDEIKKYSIYRRAVMITMEPNYDYDNLGFEGIQIKKVDIDASNETKEIFSKYNLLDNVPMTTLYESLLNEGLLNKNLLKPNLLEKSLWNQRQFYKVRNKMIKDKVRIIRLYGKNGIITNEECKRVVEKELSSA